MMMNQKLIQAARQAIDGLGFVYHLADGTTMDKKQIPEHVWQRTDGIGFLFWWGVCMVGFSLAGLGLLAFMAMMFAKS